MNRDLGTRVKWTKKGELRRDKGKVTDVMWLATCCPGANCWHTNVASHKHTCPLRSPCSDVTAPSAPLLHIHITSSKSRTDIVCGWGNSIWPSQSDWSTCARRLMLYTQTEAHVLYVWCSCWYKLNVSVGSFSFGIHLDGSCNVCLSVLNLTSFRSWRMRRCLGFLWAKTGTCSGWRLITFPWSTLRHCGLFIYTHLSRSLTFWINVNHIHYKRYRLQCSLLTRELSLNYVCVEIMPRPIV